MTSISGQPDSEPNTMQHAVNSENAESFCDDVASVSPFVSMSVLVSECIYIMDIENENGFSL